ncbi:MAG: NgoPII family restriction endonuclease [Candidatus Omnitrophica bacterium]|nr:NgoPII family restriction endonuclease [Candidatus Omnitrophota bacterium]
MSTNILKAILNLVTFNRNDLMQVYSSSNRINSMGIALEYFLKDIFCNSLNVSSINNKDKIYGEFLSYIGNQNNPPDFIVSGGDAVEVKKIEGLKNEIALNSSYPKSKLYSDSDMLTLACKKCEKWDIKDIIYSIGVLDASDKTKLKTLWMIYGDCYAANNKVYERIKNKIVEGVKDINDVELSETKELGRVNQVDPMGITNLRIRGMWAIENPVKVFDYITECNKNNKFTLFALMRNSKYQSFPKVDRDEFEKAGRDIFSIADVKIKNPDNPAKFIDAKLVKFVMN